MKKSELRIYCSKMVDKIPVGRADKKLLGDILDDLTYRMCGENLFKMSRAEIMSLDINKVKEIVRKSVGLGGEDILKVSDKLVNYDYHDYFAQTLYKEVKRVELILTDIKLDLSDFFLFMHLDHEDYLNTLLEDTYQKKHEDISGILGHPIKTKDEYFKLRKLFFEKVRENVWEKYNSLVSLFKEKMNEKSGVPAVDIIRFQKVKDLLKDRITSLDILSGIKL